MSLLIMNMILKNVIICKYSYFKYGVIMLVVDLGFLFLRLIFFWFRYVRKEIGNWGVCVLILWVIW